SASSGSLQGMTGTQMPVLSYPSYNTPGFTYPYANYQPNDSILDSIMLKDSIRQAYKDSLYVADSLKKDSIASGLPYFGYSLFKKVPEAFRPNALGPVDPGYLVGPGDILRLSVWGQVEFQYELEVSKEGKIFIPVVGQIYVTGVPFEQLQLKIKNLLSKNYSGLSSEPQQTFMDLTVAQLKPIRIFVMGEVEFPGGYTLASASTAFNALYSVGGPLKSGSLRDIKINRNGAEVASVDLYQYMLTGKCTTDVRLQNNDVVFVPPRGKTVAVDGSVFRPAIYELKDDDNLQSLLSFCGGVLPSTNIDRVQIYRIVPFDQRKISEPVVKVIDLDLVECLLNNADFELHDDDTLKVVPLMDDLKNYVTLEGAVKYPGRYQCDSLSLFDLIFTHGKPFEDRTFMKRADLIRLNDDLITTTTIPIDLSRLSEDPSYMSALQSKDRVIVYNKEVEKPIYLKIFVEGEVRNPDTFSMSTNLTVTDALLRAGGFTRKAYKKSVDVFRRDNSEPGALAKAFSVELPDSLDYVSDETKGRFQLQDQDVIVVRPDPDYLSDNYVIVDGQVRFKGKYELSKRGERLADIVNRAGGVLSDAFLEGATVTRGENRVRANFKDAIFKGDKKENILLKMGDSIYIPPKPNTVNIHGNINTTGLFSFIEGATVSDYIGRAGGVRDSTDYILLIHPSGEKEKIRKRGGKRTKVEDGSEIFVRKIPYTPEVERKGPTVGEVIRDTLAILTSAVTVITLVVKLK
ncbi:MAG: SLBB domain-containing protein, partial [Fibrobacter sp.]|nr:SLBB domain-containing protein [Fibrobacter sp.]